MLKNSFIYDAHTHMHDKAFGLDRDIRMQNLVYKNIKIITIGTDLVESKEARDLADKYDNVYFTCGLHPHDNLQENFEEKDYVDLVGNKKCVAVGECGLDYFYLKGDKEKGLIENIDREVDRQQDVFIKQIEFAKKYNKPLMIHGRPSAKDEIDNPNGVDAYEDMLFILEKYYEKSINKKLSLGSGEAAAGDTENNLTKKANGNVHFFVGDKNIAKRFMDIRFTFSFGGVITVTDDYNETLKYIPLDYMHAETDSPYVVPRDNEGKRVSKINSSENIEIIINKIAEIKSISTQDFKIKLEQNFTRDFIN
jgi:TatD DNase family protein